MAADVVVEHRHVAAGHVGDGDLVLVLDQLAQDPAHRDHVVVGMGREADHPLVARQLRAAPDLGAERVEHQAVERPGRAVLRHQGGEPMLGVVVLGELEDRLPGLVGEPHDGAHGQLGRPLDAAEQPGRRLAGQGRGRGAVDVERRVRVALQERRRHLVVHLALDGAPHDRRLVLAGGEDQDLARLEDRGHPHRQRLARHVLLAEEVGRGILPGHQVQGDQPGAALGAGARLVEADVARPTDPQQLQIDAAGGADLGLVAPQLGVHLVAGEVPARDADLLPRDVELGEQILPHEPVVGVQAPRVHGVVLVEVERRDPREAEPVMPMQADQLAVDADRGGAGGQPEHRAAAGGGLGAHDLRDPARHQAAQIVGIVDDDGADMLGGHACSKGMRGDGDRHVTVPARGLTSFP